MYFIAQKALDKNTLPDAFISLLKQASDIPKMDKGIDVVVTFVLELLQKLLDLITDYLKIDKIKVKAQGLYPELDDLSDKIYKFIDDMRLGG